MLPYVYGHSRSSVVSSASAEHGASTGAWEGAPSGRSPRGVYSPALTRGLHGRAARCIWALVSQRGTHEALPQGGLSLILGLGQLSILAWWLDANALRPQVPALERAQPPLVCQVAMPWSRPGGEGWRASKSS